MAADTADASPFFYTQDPLILVCEFHIVPLKTKSDR